MIRKLVLGLVFVGCFVVADAQLAKHVIFITIDGFRPDFYLDTPWKTPNLRMLARDGAYAKGVTSVFPTMTYPNHTTIITGVKPVKHGVYYNGMFERDGSTGKIYWNDSSIHAPTLWSAAKSKGMTVAALYWPVSADAPVDYNIPDIGSLGEPAREKYSKPLTLWDNLRKDVFNGAPQIDHGKDQNVGRIAAYIIKKSQPQLMTIHFFGVDHAQHLSGRESQMTQEAIADADEAVGIIIAALKEQGIWNQTVLMVGGDHGFYNVTRTVYPNVWLKNAGLLNDTKADWKAQFNSVGGSTYLYLRDPKDKETLAQVNKQLAALPDSTKSYFRLVSRTRMDGAGANPEVAFALTAENGASFGKDFTGADIRPGKGGAHGHFPDTKGIQTGLVAHGPGIQPGSVISQMNEWDIAPVIAKLLGLSLTSADGKVPAGLLKR